MTAEILNIKKKIGPILEKHGVQKASIFGSYARGEQTKKSDIDILIEYKDDDKGLFEFLDLQIELEKKLKKKIDLGEYSVLRSEIREKVFQEQIFIL